MKPEHPARIVIAVHTKEVRTGLFLALNGHPSISIVATATTTAELVSYCRAFEPDAAIVETHLPGRTMHEALREATNASPDSRFLLIDDNTAVQPEVRPPQIEVFSGLDQLVATFPSQGADGP